MQRSGIFEKEKENEHAEHHGKTDDEKVRIQELNGCCDKPKSHPRGSRDKTSLVESVALCDDQVDCRKDVNKGENVRDCGCGPHAVHNPVFVVPGNGRQKNYDGLNGQYDKYDTDDLVIHGFGE